MKQDTRPRIIVCDIETSGLKADFGEILVFGWKDILRDTKAKAVACFETKSYKKDILDDSDLVKLAVETLDEADVVIGHYFRRFDLPFIQTRALAHGLPGVNPRLQVVDTWEMAKYKLTLQNNRMENIVDFLKLETRKHYVPKATWRRANVGCKKALTELKTRCVSDVEHSHVMYEKLSMYVPIKVNMAAMMGVKGEVCPHCLSTEVRVKGYNYGNGTKHRRFKCKSCHRQFPSKRNEANGVTSR